jgi:hypothetical protein
VDAQSIKKKPNRAKIVAVVVDVALAIIATVALAAVAAADAGLSVAGK